MPNFGTATTLDLNSTNKISGLHYTNQVIDSAKCCGQISKSNFMVNQPFYLEGLKHNTCLNRKVTVVGNGDIKNCPSLEKIFGNISLNKLETIIGKDSFKELWSLNKSLIKTCQICEFRAICSDCRAYVDNKFDKPVNCKYDPYSMSWQTDGLT